MSPPATSHQQCTHCALNVVVVDRVILNPGQNLSVAAKKALGPNSMILRTVGCGQSDSDTEDHQLATPPPKTLVAKNRRIGSHCKLDSLDTAAARNTGS